MVSYTTIQGKVFLSAKGLEGSSWSLIFPQVFFEGNVFIISEIDS